ncbi:hypothetical protein B1A86_00007500 [Micrococcus sp. KBS0714]|nr:hypothetical protein B1A86_00007500 [Micrococcus sp. KBS0714]
MAASTSGTTCPTTGRYTTMRDSTQAVARDRDAFGQVRPELSRRAQPRSDTALADYPPLATRPSSPQRSGVSGHEKLPIGGQGMTR